MIVAAAPLQQIVAFDMSVCNLISAQQVIHLIGRIDPLSRSKISAYSSKSEQAAVRFFLLWSTFIVHT